MENVMVIKNEYLSKSNLLEEKCLTKINSKLLLKIILENYEFMPRDVAEENYSYKQIIPYVVVKFEDKYLLLKRLKKQTEVRLHNKLSIGVGGHINDQELSAQNIIIEGLYRELNEEISLEYTKPPVFLGLLNDNTSKVSQVHLGLVYLLETDSNYCIVNENEKMSANWATLDEILINFEYLETWSQIVFNILT